MRCCKCFRPTAYCLCGYAEPPIEANLKFIFLMHPKEAKRQRTGTGRLSHICLKNSEILVGLDFSHNARLRQLLSDKNYAPALMYPSPDALNATMPTFKEKFFPDLFDQSDQPADFGTPTLMHNATAVQPTTSNPQAAPARAPTLMPIIIDATWFCAKKVLEHNPFLLDLPRLSFARAYSSIFTFKNEPRADYISTIETCYYLIKEMQEAGLTPQSVNPEPLMSIFKKMISDQLRAENERIQGIRPSNHGYDWKYNKIKQIPF